MAALGEVIEQRWPLLAGIVILWLLHKFIQYYRLRRFGGPWFTHFTDLPNSVKTFLGESDSWYRSISERYGPIARTGPNSLVTSSPEVWIHVNTKPGYERTAWFFKSVRLEHRRDNIFSQCDTKLHDERRKQVAPGYSGRENDELETSIDERIQEYLTLIRTKYLSTDERIIPMDLAKKMQFFTLDVISAIGMGKCFGMLRTDADVDGYVSSAEAGFRMINTCAAVGLTGLVHAPLIGRLLCPKPTDRTGFGAMMGACFRLVDERVRAATPGHEDAGRQPSPPPRDMLASWMRHGLHGDDLRSEALEQLVVGSDTTAGALRGIMLYVMAHPRVQAKLQREIDAAVERERGTAAAAAPARGGIVSYAAARQLPYLQAVIREGLRVWPPVRGPLPKNVPPGGDTVVVDGKAVFLPGGVEIGYSSLAMHCDRRLYGEDADMFRPERWFEPDPEKLARMTRVNDLLFGHGRWQCLGKNVAQMELYKTLFELFRHFDWAIAHPATPWNIMSALGVFVIKDMWVQVTARQK